MPENNPASAFWFAFWCGVVVTIVLYLIGRPGGDYTPTRWTLTRTWLAAWFREASQDRLISVFAMSSEDDEDDTESPDNAPFAQPSPIPAKPFAITQNDRNAMLRVAEDAKVEALARLYIDSQKKPFHGQVPLTRAIKALFDESPSGDPGSEYARIKSRLTEEIKRLQAVPEPAFRDLDEHSRPVLATKAPDRVEQ